MYHYPWLAFLLGVGSLVVVQLSVLSFALLVAVAVQRMDLEGMDRLVARDSANDPGLTHTGRPRAVNNEGKLLSPSTPSGRVGTGTSLEMHTPSTAESATSPVRPSSMHRSAAAHSAGSIGACSGGVLRGSLVVTEQVTSETCSSGDSTTDSSTSMGHRPTKGSSLSPQTAGSEVGRSAVPSATTAVEIGVRRRIPSSKRALQFPSPQAETVSAQSPTVLDSASSWAWEDDFSIFVTKEP